MSAKCRSNHHIELSKVFSWKDVKFKRKELKIPFPFILITSPCLLVWLIYSYGLNVCVTAEFIYWNPNPSGNNTRKWGFGRWLGYEGELLWMGLLSLWKEPTELPSSFDHVRTQQKRQHLWIRKWAVTRHQIYWDCDLGLPKLQN